MHAFNGLSPHSNFILSVQQQYSHSEINISVHETNLVSYNKVISLHIAVQKEQTVHAVRRRGCPSFLQQLAARRTENPLAADAAGTFSTRRTTADRNRAAVTH